MTATKATDRLADWQTALRAENKSPGTVAIYADGATPDRRPARPRRRARHRPHPPARRPRLASWLTAGGEIPTDPFPGVKAPRVEPPLVEPLTDAEMRALIGACAVPETLPNGNRLAEDVLHHRRDEAIIRLMFETAIRSGEVVDLQLDDVDLLTRLIAIRRGKGGRGPRSRHHRRPRRPQAGRGGGRLPMRASLRMAVAADPPPDQAQADPRRRARPKTHRHTFGGRGTGKPK